MKDSEFEVCASTLLDVENRILNCVIELRLLQGNILDAGADRAVKIAAAFQKLEETRELLNEVGHDMKETVRDLKENGEFGIYDE